MDAYRDSRDEVIKRLTAENEKYHKLKTGNGFGLGNKIFFKYALAMILFLTGIVFSAGMFVSYIHQKVEHAKSETLSKRQEFNRVTGEYYTRPEEPFKYIDWLAYDTAADPALIVLGISTVAGLIASYAIAGSLVDKKPAA